MIKRLLLLAFFALPAAAETYIVPMWSTTLKASDGEWTAPAYAVNPNAFPVTVRVTRVFPLQTSICPGPCRTDFDPVVVEPFSSEEIYFEAISDGRSIVAGAIEVESTAPIHIHSVAQRGPRQPRIPIGIAKRWLPAGSHTIHGVEMATEREWRLNVFVINPNDHPINVRVTRGQRSGDIQATIAPRTVRVIGFTPCPGGCAVPLPYPLPPTALTVESDGEFLTGVSSITEHWAVFSLAEGALL